jgi:predicted nucleotidyltransferase
MIRTTLIEKRDEILRIGAKHGACNVRIFGSVARGTDNEASDVDLLVEFDPDRSLMDHTGLVLELEALLGRAVEVGTPNGLRQPYRQRVLNEAVNL